MFLFSPDCFFLGNCSIFPRSGIAFQTSFTITCQDWVDPDPPLLIQFTYMNHGVRVIFAYQTVASGKAVTVVDRLPVGDMMNDFKLNISVLVQDVIGSKSEHILTVKVYHCLRKLSHNTRRV